MDIAHCISLLLVDVRVISTVGGFIMNNASTNICVEFFVWICFQSLGYLPRSGTAGSYNSAVFNSLRNFEIRFQVATPFFHPHQQCLKVPISSRLGHSLFFLITALLAGERW